MLPPAHLMLLSVLTSFAANTFTHIAAAQDSPYCRQVRARAASEAGLLMTPRVHVQGIRFPRGAQQLDSGPTVGDGYQVRTGLAFSPLDFLKGQSTLRVGDADCQRHEAALSLDAVLVRGQGEARIVALRQQGDFLKAHSGEWRGLAEKAASRFAQRIITVVEFTDVQRSLSAIEQKMVRIEGEAEQLEARRGPEAPNAAPLSGAGLVRANSAAPLGPVRGASNPAALPALAERYYRDTLELEQEASRLRQLDDWKFQFTGGVIPLAPVDWYGTLELSVSFGALTRSDHEQRFLDARSDELRSSRDGVAARLEQFRREAGAALRQAQRELDVVQRSLDVLRSTRSALQASEAESVAQVRDMLTIEQLSVESDAVFLRSLVEALASLVSEARG